MYRDQRYMDYCHFNPVKHRLVNNVKEWPYSIFDSLVKKGIYPKEWGANIVLNAGERD